MDSLNTSDSIKKVTPVSELPREEREQLPRAEPKGRNPHGTVVTTRLYEEDLVDLDEEDVSITQQLESMGYFAVVEKDGRCRALPVTSFLVFDDGSIFGADEEGVDLAEQEGFRGYVFSDGRAMLNSKRVRKLLEETRLEEV